MSMSGWIKDWHKWKQFALFGMAGMTSGIHSKDGPILQCSPVFGAILNILLGLSTGLLLQMPYFGIFNLIH